jgi:murein DD-endopeptidase MepM/ murein hydrolase activator NlpD
VNQWPAAAGIAAMTRRTGFVFLGAAILFFVVCAALIAWRLLPARLGKVVAPANLPVQTAAPETKPVVAKPSTIIDLPGDPVLVHRGATLAPRSLQLAAPAFLAANAPRVDMPAFYVSSPLVSTDGGFMGKFQESGQEADAITAQIAITGEGADAALTPDQAAAGFDDDGGAETADVAPDLTFTAANSNQLDVSIGGANGQPQIKQALIKTIVAEKIGDLLVRNGYSEESARAVEAAAKAAFNVQSLPPGSIAVAIGALDLSGAYRVTQFSIYEDKEYVGAVALAEAGGYGEGAQPTVPEGLIDDSQKAGQAITHYTIADGIYSAGLRNNIPEPVIREAIALLGKLTDVKAPVQTDQTLRALYARDFRGKTKTSGKVIYLGLVTPTATIDCYSFALTDAGPFQCFDPKASASVTLPGGTANTGASSIGGILTPIKGTPITSPFSLARMHPILHIVRAHLGIDFGAPIGSPVRAVADGKVEFTGPKAGFGNQVKIQHKGFETSVNHLSEIPESIKPGVMVTQGQIIALSGNTGLSTGPHLHFEFYLDGSAVDPMPHFGTEVGGLDSSTGGGTTFTFGPTPAQIDAFNADKEIVDAALGSVTH